ncbi:hypothetical protein RR42_s2317 [Cupriavidus basilensis]|uniref:Uncharacterized protein n=1 Tax=Cupriavidus basilensis TaxID=68895 RepID=A0A0C4YPB0_9BURK|nr:hypothetical protein RR42_s2317 [Cupriavidus basilensis]
MTVLDTRALVWWVSRGTGGARAPCPLVTKDEKIRAYPHVKTIW